MLLLIVRAQKIRELLLCEKKRKLRICNMTESDAFRKRLV